MYFFRKKNLNLLRWAICCIFRHQKKCQHKTVYVITFFLKYVFYPFACKKIGQKIKVTDVISDKTWVDSFKKNEEYFVILRASEVHFWPRAPFYLLMVLKFSYLMQFHEIFPALVNQFSREWLMLNMLNKEITWFLLHLYADPQSSWFELWPLLLSLR